MQKLNLSNLQQTQTTREVTIQQICDLTGLPEALCEQKYNELKYDYNDEEIVGLFEQKLNEQKAKSIANNQKVNDLLNYDFRKLNESKHQQYFLDNLKVITDENAKLEVIKNLMQSTDGSDVAIMKPLFEGIQHDMSYMNKIYQPDNMFNIIMDNVNRIVQQNLLKKEMVSDDNMFYLDVIRTIFSGQSDGFYTNISTIQNTISDTQTLLFDLVIFVNKFIETKTTELKYVNTKTIREYQNVSNDLITNIYSSVNSSRILNREFVNKNDSKNPYNVITQVTGKIDEDFFININVDLYQIDIKSIDDSLKLIDSMKHLFKQPITRKLVSLFVTKTRQLVSDLNRVILATKFAKN